MTNLCPINKSLISITMEPYKYIWINRESLLDALKLKKQIRTDMRVQDK